VSQKFSVTDLGRINLAQPSGGTYKTTNIRLMKVTGPTSNVQAGNMFSGLGSYFSEVHFIQWCGNSAGTEHSFLEYVGSTIGSANVATVKALYRRFSTGLRLSASVDMDAINSYCLIGGIAA
jgi:hypothetical protein